MHRLDTLVIDHPTEVLAEPIAGRHRAPSSAARRAVTRIVVGLLALLVVAVIGWSAADAAGLTSTPGADLPAWSALPSEDEPDTARAARRPARQAPMAAPDAVDAGLFAASTASVPAAPDPTRAPQSTVEPSRAPLVQVGDTCSSRGAVGTTAKGKQVVCTARGGSARWKHV